jgi:hypothetical protein
MSTTQEIVGQRRWWCEVLGLSVWGVIDEKTVAEAASRSLLAAHPDKRPANEDGGAGREIHEILTAKAAGKRHARSEARKAEALERSPMDWESALTLSRF